MGILTRPLLVTLDHQFDVKGITESRLNDTSPILNIDIEGYEFVHTPTNSRCGGALIYSRNGYQYE